MKAIVLMAAVSALLAACGQENPSQQSAYQPPLAAQAAPQPSQAPVIVQSAPAHSGMQDMITGAAIGALATHALSGGSKTAAPSAPTATNNTHTRVVERTVIIKQAAPVAQAPKPAATISAAAPRPTATPYTPPRTSYAPPSVVTPTYRPSPTPSRR